MKTVSCMAAVTVTDTAAEMENGEFEDILDDWFIESLSTYTDLHVYQLEHSTEVIEWTSAKTVCVAGNSVKSKNEILELRLPPKLFADDNKGLCAERDFKVLHGGFTDGPVRRLKHIPGTKTLVTNDGLTSDLLLYECGPDGCDVIRRTGLIHGRKTEGGGGEERGGRGGRRSDPGRKVRGRSIRMCVSPSSRQHVLHAAHGDEVTVSDVITGRNVYNLDSPSSTHPLSSLQYVSEFVFLATCFNGELLVGDTRTSHGPRMSHRPNPEDKSELWWSDATMVTNDCYQDSRIVRLSSSGHTVVSDLRSLNAPWARARLDGQSRRTEPDDVTVCWAPNLRHCISVSGFNGTVQILDSTKWTCDGRRVEPLFEHKGHMMVPSQCHNKEEEEEGGEEEGGGGGGGEEESKMAASVFVSAHVWHPEKPRTVLSAASDGSVHVWDWIDGSV